jgi:hypothetical protein
MIQEYSTDAKSRVTHTCGKFSPTCDRSLGPTQLKRVQCSVSSQYMRCDLCIWPSAATDSFSTGKTGVSEHARSRLASISLNMRFDDQHVRAFMYSSNLALPVHCPFRVCRYSGLTQEIIWYSIRYKILSKSICSLISRQLFWIEKVLHPKPYYAESRDAKTGITGT